MNVSIKNNHKAILIITLIIVIGAFFYLAYGQAQDERSSIKGGNSEEVGVATDEASQVKAILSSEDLLKSLYSEIADKESVIVTVEELCEIDPVVRHIIPSQKLLVKNNSNNLIAFLMPLADERDEAGDPLIKAHSVGAEDQAGISDLQNYLGYENKVIVYNCDDQNGTINKGFILLLE